MNKKQKVTLEVVEEISSLLERGMIYREVAEVCHLSISTVRKVGIKTGVRSNRITPEIRKISEEKRVEITQLFMEKSVKIKDVANKIGCNKDTVRYVLEERGFSLQKRSQEEDELYTPLVVDLIKRGKTPERIVRILSITPKIVKRIILNLGGIKNIDPDRIKRIQERDELVVSLWKEGISIREISLMKDVDLTDRMIRHVLLNMGCDPGKTKKNQMAVERAKASPPPKEELVRLSALTNEEIAKLFDTTLGVVTHWKMVRGL